MKSSAKLAKKHITVLVIDDEPDFVKHLSKLFKRNEKYEVIAAYDGMQGLEKAKEINPDIILLDILMPDLDGFEILKLLKESKKTLGIPVIMLTALTTQEARLESLKLYSEGFIEKPVSVEKIMQIIDGTLDRREEFKERIKRNEF